MGQENGACRVKLVFSGDEAWEDYLHGLQNNPKIRDRINE